MCVTWPPTDGESVNIQTDAAREMQPREGPSAVLMKSAKRWFSASNEFRQLRELRERIRCCSLRTNVCVYSRTAKRIWRLIAAVLVFCAVGSVWAQTPAPSEASSPGFFESWLEMVSRTQAAQPHWITPLATVTPRLEQEFRFDTDWLTNSSGITAENYDGGKGIEIIPSPRIELLLNLPPYLAHNSPTVHDGFGDASFMLKYRLLAANEEGGNYILAVFFAGSIPTGSYTNGSPDAIVTPTIGYGKGFGQFDAQGTFGVSLPTGNEALIGHTYSWNNAIQYHMVRAHLWPEVEVNYSHFQDGKNSGQRQVFITPGMVIGKLHLWGRAGLTFGGGIQIAATHFHTTDHNGILSVRIPF